MWLFISSTDIFFSSRSIFWRKIRGGGEGGGGGGEEEEKEEEEKEEDERRTCKALCAIGQGTVMGLECAVLVPGLGERRNEDGQYDGGIFM